MKMLSLRQSSSDLRVGPKARRLGQALRLGLPVPDGIVVLPDEELASLPQLLAQSLAHLPGERFAVRSAAAVEDLAGRSAAGIFHSYTDVPRQQVADAVRAVRESGRTPQAKAYCGAAVEVPVLIQPMVPAERLGVMYLDRRSGSAVCEERPASAPEWSSVSARAVARDEASLTIARRLAELLEAEAVAAYIEYAVLPDGSVQFLQLRPAPAMTASQLTPPAWPEGTPDLIYVHDQEHNPDPLSAAQSGLVEGVADLVTSFDQRVIGGYLYYAQRPAATEPSAEPSATDLAQHYARDIAPRCEALLQPLEQTLNADDGALAPRLLSDPSLCQLSLRQALAAYRGVYQIYVAQLSPALRRSRQRLDAFLQRQLQQSLVDPRHGHAALLAAAAHSPTERLQALFELGQAEAALRPRLLRGYLARYGAFASSWDIAAPCDDERQDWLLETAQRLARAPEPREKLAISESTYRAAWARLLSRLPAAAHDEARALLTEARTARRLAEEDDGLFFRAQRLCRWALLRRGALLVAAGRLLRIASIFDLPWALHVAQLDDVSGQSFAPQHDLQALARDGEQARAAARAVVPPPRLQKGQPVSLQFGSATAVLQGHGVAADAGASGRTGPVRGRARVVKALFPAPALDDLGPDDILVLPALLPSWAAELWQARALVTDSGGALSHGAILARERGVPAVVGTRDATRRVAEGQELLVDAEHGRVYLC